MACLKLIARQNNYLQKLTKIKLQKEKVTKIRWKKKANILSWFRDEI